MKIPTCALMAISPHVISAPYSLQILLKGKLPTVVNGAKYNLFAQSIFLKLFSAKCSGFVSSKTVLPSVALSILSLFSASGLMSSSFFGSESPVSERK
jgi:hypothetical protein